MRQYAMSLGVPDEDILLDYSGQRTYDTCYRARYVFNLEQVVLVTQAFHMPRALYLCNALGLPAVGVESDLRSVPAVCSRLLESARAASHGRRVVGCAYYPAHAGSQCIRSCRSLGESMNRIDALAIVHEFVKNESLVRHMLAVEAAMRFYAEKVGEDAELWGITGLLHDFDWEIHPSLEKHPQAGIPLLEARRVPQVIIRGILSHADHTGVARVTPMEKALAACDEITGLVTAVALVRPSRSLYDLTASSVKKKWKDRAFAAGASREEIEKATAEFDIPLWEHVDNIILAMRRIAPELGLEGAIPNPA